MFGNLQGAATFHRFGGIRHCQVLFTTSPSPSAQFERVIVQRGTGDLHRSDRMNWAISACASPSCTPLSPPMIITTGILEPMGSISSYIRTPPPAVPPTKLEQLLAKAGYPHPWKEHDRHHSVNFCRYQSLRHCLSHAEYLCHRRQRHRP